jgi:hypothetical protein
MPDTYLDRMLTHAVYFERYKTHEVNQLLKVLDEANVACKAEVARTDGAATKARYLEIMKEIRKIKDDAISKIDGQLKLDMHDLTVSEIDSQIKMLKAVGVDTEFIRPAPVKVYTAATFMPFADSSTFEKMLNDLDSSLYSTWDMSVRVGYLAGETAQVINRRVLGSISNLQPGVMQKLRNALDRNTRTMISHYADQARKSVYRANEDIFFGYRRLETLDSRTCLVCGALDGKTYKRLEDCPGVVHHLCRGLDLPLIRGIDDNPDFPPGERASVDGPVNAKTSYEDWLKRQPEAVQKDVLGPSRYKLFKNGASLGSFVTDRRTLTLEQWKSIEGNAKFDVKPTAAPKPTFTPAKTVKEAEQWARDNLGVRFAGYGKIPVEVVNEWNKGAFDNITRFPELKKTFRDIGTNQELRRNYIDKYVADCLNDQSKTDHLKQFGYATKEQQEKIFRKWGAAQAGKTAGNTWATSYSNEKYRAGVGINEKWAKDPAAFQKSLDYSLQKGFHPVGCNTIKSVIDHEMGHEIDKLLNRLSYSKEFDKIVQKVDIVGELSAYPCTYANADIRRREIFAEAWSEYLNNESPRPLAKQIGELIEAKYKELFGGSQ